MSSVTNLILTFSISENEIERVKEIQSYPYGNGKFEICSIDDRKLPRKWYGGSKIFEWNVFIGAYNYLDLDGFINHLKSKVNWEYKEYVQLFILGENDLSFKIYTLSV